MSLPAELPSFIPDDLLHAYADDARRHVERTRPRTAPHQAATTTIAAGRPQPHARREPVVVTLPARPALSAPLIAAMLLGLAGSVVVTALWSWLAVSQESVVWWWLAAGGFALVAVSSLLVARVLAGSGR
ncbi:MAG TPA: hypothetical protein VM324_03450 [Egibacteraceae bacterium]|nr:hypothetical protein [Egibacteraceae bacterium]